MTTTTPTITRKALHERTALVCKRIQAAMDRRRLLRALLSDARAAVDEERRALLLEIERELVAADECEAEAVELLEAG